MSSSSPASLPSLHSLRFLLSVGAALWLLAACATGSSPNSGDDDDDGVAGGGATSTGTATAGTGGTVATGGSGTGGARAPTAGEVIFIELMPDPDQLSDEDAEFCEIKNVSSAVLELQGCLLTDADPSGDEATITGSVRINPGEILIFAKSANAAVNGNLPNVAFAFGTDYALANSGDEAQLECSGQLIDSVAYTSDWPYDTGASMQLRSTNQTAIDNDSSANWCTATATYASGNFGTPGTDVGHCL
jgi:hypothetical protein